MRHRARKLDFQTVRISRKPTKSLYFRLVQNRQGYMEELTFSIAPPGSAEIRYHNVTIRNLGLLNRKVSDYGAENSLPNTYTRMSRLFLC